MLQTKFRQIAFIYISGVCCFSAFLLPDVIGMYADKAAVSVPLLGIGFSLLFSYVLYRALRRYGSLKNMVEAKWGKRGVKVIGFTFAAWLSFLAVFYIQAFYDRLASTAFAYMPRWVVLCAVALCAAFFAYTSQKTIARGSSVIFLILLLTLAVLLAFSAAGIEVKSLLPVKYKTFTLFVRAFLYPVGMAGLLTFFLFYYEDAPVRLRALGGCYIAAAAVMSGIIFVTQGVFGVAFSRKISYAFFALIKSTDFLIKLEHFESLISGVWIVMSLGFFIALMSVIVTLLLQNIRPESNAGKTCLPLLPYIGVLAVALVIPENRFMCEFVLSTVMPLGNILLGIVPICILSLTNKK